MHQTPCRTLAVDLGTKRVGLALSDEGGSWASPFDVLEINSPQQAADGVAAVVAKEGVQRIVVGLPLNMDDSFGPQAKNAVAWGNALSQRTGVPAVFVDERLSSFEAEQHLKAAKRAGAKLTRQDKKRRLDALAAVDFLQAFLDGKLNAIAVPSSAAPKPAEG